MCIAEMGGSYYSSEDDYGMEKLLARVGRLALHSLFPLKCAGSGREGKTICESCHASLPRLAEPYCSICARPNSPQVCGGCRTAPLHLKGIRAPYLMEGAIREAVHDLKFRNPRASAPCLGRLLSRYFLEKPLPAGFLVPVPLHRRRLRQRGYNQSALLAKDLAKRVGIPVSEGTLVRIKDNPPQVSLDRAQRMENVEGSFECGDDVKGKAILLVDDVATTGSTLSACGAALKEGGAASVWALVLAREP